MGDAVVGVCACCVVLCLGGGGVLLKDACVCVCAVLRGDVFFFVGPVLSVGVVLVVVSSLRTHVCFAQRRCVCFLVYCAQVVVFPLRGKCGVVLR